MCGCNNKMSGFSGNTTFLGVDYPELRDESSFLGGLFGGSDKIGTAERQQLQSEAADYGGPTAYMNYLYSISDNEKADRVKLMLEENAASVQKREKTGETISTIFNTGLNIFKTIKDAKSGADSPGPAAAPTVKDDNSTMYWVVGIVGVLLVLGVTLAVIKMRK